MQPRLQISLKPLSHTLKVLGLIAFLITSCTADKKPVKDVIDDQAKPVDPPMSAPAQKEGGGSAELNFFKQQNSETNGFSLEDEQFFTSLSRDPEKDSEAEAALAVGIVKLVLKLSSAEQKFQENELIEDDETKPAASLRDISLEALTLEKGLNLPRALKSNPLLRDLQFYKLSLKALKSSNNSVNFTNTINQTISDELKNWGQPKRDDAVAQQEIQTQVSTNDWKLLELTVADVRIGDNILMEAQSLADNKMYKDAISKVSQIEQASPLFNSAKAKVIEFSDLAVQDLRQKAAQAFQSAIPVSDPRARAAYLVKAKEHLEQALQKYPQAPVEQLSTVRENLAVISRDLEKLESKTVQ